MNKLVNFVRKVNEYSYRLDMLQLFPLSNRVHLFRLNYKTKNKRQKSCLQNCGDVLNFLPARV